MKPWLLVLVLLIASLAVSLTAVFWRHALAAVSCAEEAVYDADSPGSFSRAGLHVVMQPPEAVPLAERQQEYHTALLETLMHPDVAYVHVLTESVAHQTALYQEVVPRELQHKLRTFNINKRIWFADAVRYANKYLNNATAMLCNADVSVYGANWGLINWSMLKNRMLAITRHEQPGCSDQCGCTLNWNGCMDCFALYLR